MGGYSECDPGSKYTISDVDATNAMCWDQNNRSSVVYGVTDERVNYQRQTSMRECMDFCKVHPDWALLAAVIHELDKQKALNIT